MLYVTFFAIRKQQCVKCSTICDPLPGIRNLTKGFLLYRHVYSFIFCMDLNTNGCIVTFILKEDTKRSFKNCRVIEIHPLDTLFGLVIFELDFS